LIAKPWSPEEDAKVLELVRQGKTPVVIAAKLREPCPPCEVGEASCWPDHVETPFEDAPTQFFARRRVTEEQWRAAAPAEQVTEFDAEQQRAGSAIYPKDVVAS